MKRSTIGLATHAYTRTSANDLSSTRTASSTSALEIFSIGEVRGKGLMQGIELVKDRGTKEPAPEATTRLLERTRENGLLIGKGGLYGNVVRLSPMLNISKADVDEAVRVLDKSFAEVRV